MGGDELAELGNSSTVLRLQGEETQVVRIPWGWPSPPWLLLAPCPPPGRDSEVSVPRWLCSAVNLPWTEHLDSTLTFTAS